MPGSTYLPDEIVRFIEATGESDNIDAKAGMTWDGQAASAGLAKDLAAFANSRDGGVIVLGKSEPSSGKFQLDGMSGPQVESFDTTKVASWVNARFAPPIRLVCHRQEHRGKTFVVITISEFDDVPHICTKSFQDPTNGKNLLLREGAIYVRTANASSAPLTTVDEVRTLIGLATAKRKNEMLAMVDAMFKGRPLVAPPSDQDQFDTEYMRIISGLGEPVKKMIDAGAWVFRAHPITYCEERWRTTEELEKLIQRRSVRLRDEFPPHRRGTHAREWGVANDLYGETWSLARSGQFVYVKEFWENHQEYVSPWRVVGGSRETPKAAPGEWVDYKPSIYQIVELFAFLIRLVEEYETGEAIVFEVKATNLAGRVLLSTDRNIDLHFRFAEPCRASTFDVRKQMSSEELRAGWERICAATMKRFTDLFPSQHIGEDTMVGWIKKFLERKF